MSDEERDRPGGSAEEPEESPVPADEVTAESSESAGGGDESAATETEPAVESDPAAEEKAAADAEAKAAAEAKAKAEALAKKKAEAAAKKAAIEAAKPPWERDPATPDWKEAADDAVARALSETHGGAILSSRTFAGDLTLEVERGSIRDVCRTLKEEHGYTLLLDVCGADYPDEEVRFEVVYHLYGFEPNRRLRLKVKAADGEEVPTVTPVWRAANWSEREVYDMYGVRFADHPDMTRILLWEGFNGYPLRKDFPIEGIDTGSAIYPEYYDDEAGPVAGTGTGWKPPEPPAPEEPEPAAEETPETS